MQDEIKQENFREFLMEHISAADFEKLNEFLGESKKLTTQVINDPAKGNMNHLSTIVRLIKKTHSDINETMLVEKFGFGSNELTPTQRELLSN